MTYLIGALKKDWPRQLLMIQLALILNYLVQWIHLGMVLLSENNVLQRE